MLAVVRSSIAMLLCFTVLTGGAYPFVVTIFAQGLFRHQANGSVIVDNAKIVGSELLGQPFDGDQYFWSRPSATSPFPYNGGSSGASNLGPTNPDFLKAIKERVEAIQKAHPDQTGPVPGDLVTSSASGLDPHISPAAADYQASRVAGDRKMPIEQVRKLIAEHTEQRTLGVLGEPRVHVLRLNLALDAAGK